MINLRSTQLSLQSIYLLLLFLPVVFTGCEQRLSVDIAEGPPTGQVASPMVECEKFLCADISSLHVVRVHVEENVGIGVPREHRFQHELEVNGTILAEEILVQPNVADYVFNPGYELKPLDSIERFIHEHRHLPGVPSSSALELSGGKLGIGESYRVLLEKIEELTLYAIEQDKRIDRLESELAQRLGNED